MVLCTSEPTLKISKNIYCSITFRIIFCKHVHLDQPAVAHQNIKINHFKAFKSILTNQRLCYAQLDQATETLLGPATNNMDQATKCGLI